MERRFRGKYNRHSSLSGEAELVAVDNVLFASSSVLRGSTFQIKLRSPPAPPRPLSLSPTFPEAGITPDYVFYTVTDTIDVWSLKTIHITHKHMKANFTATSGSVWLCSLRIVLAGHTTLCHSVQPTFTLSRKPISKPAPFSSSTLVGFCPHPWQLWPPGSSHQPSPAWSPQRVGAGGWPVEIQALRQEVLKA